MKKVININFETESEFRQKMLDHAYEIHSNTLYAIDQSYNMDLNEAIIATLNDTDVMGIPKDAWVDNLDHSLGYFEGIEDYEKCAEIKQLINKLI
jgi:hypothetical protein